jgi:hypothetical protein
MALDQTLPFKKIECHRNAGAAKSRRFLQAPSEAARDFCSMSWRQPDATTTFQRNH